MAPFPAAKSGLDQAQIWTRLTGEKLTDGEFSQQAISTLFFHSVRMAKWGGVVKVTIVNVVEGKHFKLTNRLDRLFYN